MATKSCVVSVRLFETEKARLDRLARRWGRTPTEAGARLMQEGLRTADFAGIEFRDGPGGRVVYLRGTRLPVWMVTRLARQFGGDAQQVADHLEISPLQVQAALNYAEAFPDEIQDAIEDYEATTAEDLRRQLPGLEVFTAQAKSQRKAGR